MARAISTSALPNNSSTSLASSVSARSGNDSNDNNESLYNDDDESMSTIPDPRTKGSFSANGSSPPHHPDLNDEVATLSNKLINAINHQTNLDDTLNKTRQQLADSRSRIRQLELEAEGHQNDIADGTLVLSVDVIAERKKLLALIKDETDRRGVAEKEKKAIELELETLTTALFEEANKVRPFTSQVSLC